MSENFGSDRMWGLKELAPPDPVSWLPQAPGWWVVLALVLVGLVWLGLWQRRRLAREQYRREALARLAALESEGVAELPRVLRATALTAYPREEVASLRGLAWVSWLNRNGGRFEEADAALLDGLPYDAALAAGLAPETSRRLLAGGRAFVRRHRART
ncbi:MAG: DUF4381 domain-containing protein [Myxococcota bacterium]|nr:DUF4381 domain-containing protein [Myxococcota bacterium]